jgi:two-component system, chemotaxis family, chemotaxis protein CheY
MEPAMKHCMIVDDSEVIRKVARRLLENMDQVMISEAENGQDALERCRARMPDAILVDWHMPVMSGIDFMVALRIEKGGKTPHIIYCTSENDADDIARAVGSGANDVLIKPFDRESFDAKFWEAGIR